MTLRLNGSTSGYTEIDAPAVAGSNTLVLPTGAGSANQFLKNGSTAGSLGWSSMVEDSSGRVGIGTTSPNASLVVAASGAAGFEVTPGSATASSGTLIEHYNRSTAAYVQVRTIASVHRFDIGGTEAGRFDSSGRFLVGKTSSGFSTAGTELYANGEVDMTASANSPLYINRTTNDGNLIAFYQDGTLEGNINVSGSTVALAGAHLARYSQLPAGATREEILRGTVLSNIDEMCAWSEEENEQLNRMKVSDVEGDPNVAGVFQAWDDDDDTYTDDFYCAMTGDFIIRIAEGVTVQRGDLLMSAGDGTAKPQDDDIIRSKTVAKVTSTHVTCTYEDGSYCVPCVLMAC
jgi:hypothetical protein